MAKALKTLKFPGIAETYTVPVVDSTLSIEGAAADAKAVADAIQVIQGGGAIGNLPDMTGVLPVAKGGTGATDRKTAIQSLAFLGYNPVTSVESDTISTWAKLGTGYANYNIKNQITDQPNQWGLLVSIVSASEVFQIWKNQPGGATYIRSGNVNGWAHTWRQLYDSQSTVPIANGGTGATSRKDAAQNLAYFGADPIASEQEDTREAWTALGTGFCHFTKIALKNQPSGWCTVFNLCYGTVVVQFLKVASGGGLWFRDGNANGWNNQWTIMYDSATGIIYRDTQPGAVKGRIWLKPIEQVM